MNQADINSVMCDAFDEYKDDDKRRIVVGATGIGIDFLNSLPKTGRQEKIDRRKLKKQVYNKMLSEYQPVGLAVSSLILWWVVRQVLWWLAQKLLERYLNDGKFDSVDAS